MSGVKIILIGGLLVVLVLGGSWLAVLFARHPTQHPLAGVFPWPVVCTTRGCITSTAWVRQQALVKTFVEAVHEPLPPEEEALTTLVRQHLVSKALLQEVVKLEDAARYRREVLRLKDGTVTRQLSTLSPEDFDRAIALPFLQQEALRQQLKLEPEQDLFVHLARDRWISLLTWHFRWDANKAEVVRK